MYNAALKASRRKNFEIFLSGAFLSCVVDEMFIEVPLFQETSPVKFLVAPLYWVVNIYNILVVFLK